MKTITLTEDAYERIAALKTSPKDSFSRVILRVVPKRGTASQMLAAVAELPKLTAAQEKKIRVVAAEHNDWASVRDPWTAG